MPSNLNNGTGYTNLQKIFNANQNNGLANTIGTGINSQVNKTQNALNTGVNEFNQQVGANTVGTQQDIQNRQDVLNRISGNTPISGNVSENAYLGNAGNSYNTNAPQTATPADNSNNPNYLTSSDVGTFAKYRNGLYGGPTDISNIGDIQNQASNAKNLGQSTTSNIGRQGLLQQFVGNGQYNQGQQRLDNALIGNSDALKSARQNANQLQNTVNTTDAAARANAQQAANTTAGFAQSTNGLLNNGTSNIVNALNTAATNANTNAGGFLSKVQNDLNAGTLTQDELNVLNNGLAPGQSPLQLGQSTYGTNLANYLNLGNQATGSNIANTNDVAKLQALAQLGGLSGVTGIDTTQAGQYTGPINTQLGAFNTALANNQAQYQKDLATKIQQPYGQTFNDINDVNNFLNKYSVPAGNDNQVEGVGISGGNNNAYTLSQLGQQIQQQQAQAAQNAGLGIYTPTAWQQPYNQLMALLNQNYNTGLGTGNPQTSQQFINSISQPTIGSTDLSSRKIIS